ncbi:hypothetical protein NDU88_001179 [Pleurodeles waltl]|uniref:Uncharacterized protein n=1 Tax=Pleurodeles waltl TaxID=8319 RepID=A0AAV7P6C4_PLEWA|nr:hypothetical protein NDU88_001179 [Pleurodeles waltl]
MAHRCSQRVHRPLSCSPSPLVDCLRPRPASPVVLLEAAASLQHAGLVTRSGLGVRTGPPRLQSREPAAAPTPYRPATTPPGGDIRCWDASLPEPDPPTAERSD